MRTCGIMESFLGALRSSPPGRGIGGLSFLSIQTLFFAFIEAMQLLPVLQGEGVTFLLTLILCSLPPPLFFFFTVGEEHTAESLGKKVK